MAESLGVDGEVRELKLGSSFDTNASLAYHSIRYDFKPASVDKSQMAKVEIGESNSVMVTVPHIEGSGVTSTVYKGNKRPSQKECILVIDHQTGEITLERLTSNIQLKKTRQESHSVPQRSHAATDNMKKDLKASPSKKKNTLPHENSQHTPTSDVHQITEGINRDIDLMSSSASSDSDDDKSASCTANPPLSDATKKEYHSVLSMDLQLSESSSDSD